MLIITVGGGGGVLWWNTPLPTIGGPLYIWAGQVGTPFPRQEAREVQTEIDDLCSEFLCAELEENKEDNMDFDALRDYIVELESETSELVGTFRVGIGKYQKTKIWF